MHVSKTIFLVFTAIFISGCSSPYKDSYGNDKGYPIKGKSLIVQADNGATEAKALRAIQYMESITSDPYPGGTIRLDLSGITREYDNGSSKLYPWTEINIRYRTPPGIRDQHLVDSGGFYVAYLRESPSNSSLRESLAILKGNYELAKDNALNKGRLSK